MSETLAFTLGLVMGITIAALICIWLIQKAEKNDKPYGVLHVETSDPDGNYLFLELHTDVTDVMKQDYVRFKVDTESYISQ